MHPLVVHFPIALLTTFLILEILSLILKSESLKTGASWMLYTGTIGTFVTVIAGFRAAGAVGHDEVIHAIMETHEHLGLVVLVLAVILSLWRIFFKRKLAGSLWIVYLALSIIMVVVLSFGADLGGLMVYTHGVAVKAVPKKETVGHDHNAHENKETKKPETIKNAPDTERDTAPKTRQDTPSQDHHDSTPHDH